MTRSSVPDIRLNNGVNIPQLGLGVFQTPVGKTTVDAVRNAIKTGYRLIDTAQAYYNEESVGEGVRESGIRRREVFVTTKLWNADVRSGNVREAFGQSLDRLGMDYLDLYLIHWPAEGWQRAWEQMVEFYKDRRIRAIGVCNFQERHLKELMSISDVLPAVDQIESSPQFMNQELIDFAKSHNIVVEAWGPLGGTGGNLLSDQRLDAIGRRHGKSPAQVVIRWHLQRGIVTIPKSVHEERIKENFDVFDFELSDDEMKEIDAMETGKRNGADPDNFDF